MSRKVITGYKSKIENDDYICPNCGKICLGIMHQKGFFKVKTISEYTCSRCGCQWEVTE